MKTGWRWTQVHCQPAVLFVCCGITVTSRGISKSARDEYNKNTEIRNCTKEDVNPPGCHLKNNWEKRSVFAKNSLEYIKANNSRAVWKEKLNAIERETLGERT